VKFNFKLPFVVFFLFSFFFSSNKSFGAQGMDGSFLWYLTANDYEMREFYSKFDFDEICRHWWRVDSRSVEVRSKNRNIIKEILENKGYHPLGCTGAVAITKPSKEKPEDKPQKGGSGSAFFVNSKGSIVTNNHVIERCSGPIKILYNKKEYNTNVVAKDGVLDLAILSSDVKPNQYLKLSKKSGEKLDRVVAAGYPLGYKISDELKLTAGIVSANKGWKDNINEFQIDAALNPGNSGGPVINDAGNLFGVAVAGLTDRQNLNFAIKSKAVKDFLDANKVSYSTATMERDMDNKTRLKLLEDSTVFIYCN
jgi:S1-C subfamily serine protease